MFRLRLLIVFALSCFFASAVFAQGNGNLQIHFIDVGQGDGALLISPGGQTVLFDDGRQGACNKPPLTFNSLAYRNSITT